MKDLVERFNDKLCGDPEFFREEAIHGHIETSRVLNRTNLIKAVHVLEYLGQLREEGLDPLFKGGSAVQLLLPSGWQRLSIDLDLAIKTSKKDFEEVLSNIYEKFGREYYAYELRNEQNGEVPFYNYRLTIPTFGDKATILLDVMSTNVGYETQRRSLNSFFYESEIKVKTPSIDAIIGDKFSILGPNTIGRYLKDSRNGLEYVKHLYDIRNLLPHIKDLGKTFEAYKKCHKLQLMIRGGSFDLKECLENLIYVCKFLTLTPETENQTSFLGGEEGKKTLEYYKTCKKGLEKKFQPFLSQDNVFTWDNLRETAAIIAFTISLIEKSESSGEAVKKAIEEIPQIAQEEATVDKMISEITSQPKEERWHIEPTEIKESPALAVYWYGHYFPDALKENL